jgi:transcriptional regulator with PAS, ATPase and Fis domain
VGPRVGRFEQAHKGTLFLDEIGTMSANLQAKLLRVLQEREFERLGESVPTRIDVRVIAATNSDLGRMVREGTFREDLYYRVNVIPVRLPPLRERREDIPLLVQHFLDRIGRDLDPPRSGVSFSQQAVRQLMAYDWPGNVRQLENLVERALTLGAGRQQIDVDMLPDEIRAAATAAQSGFVTLPEDGFDLDAHLAGIERDLIDQSLERTGGNKRKAAQILGLKRTTLVEKLKRLQRS